jgi:hypothetical protein
MRSFGDGEYTLGVAYRRDGARSTRANPYLLLAGAGAMVVATVGLFVRASPTLSGLFLVVGAALVVISVFAPEYKPARAQIPANLELASLEQANPGSTLAHEH